MSVPGPADDHNGIIIRIGVPRHAVRVRNPMRVYPVPGCAHAAAHKAIIAAIALAQLRADAIISVPTSDYTTARSLAGWWDDWNISIRKVLLAATNTSRQGLTKSNRQRLHRLYVELNTAILVARTPDTSPSSNDEGCDQPRTPDTSVELRRKVAECRRLWQRTKQERLLVQHTYTPGEKSRRFYARVATKF